MRSRGRHGEGLAAEEVRRVSQGRLRRPTIFVVGDHKQSIYRFRNARVEIVAQAEDWIRKGLPGEPAPGVTLQWNFRSIPALQAFVNDAGAAIAEAATRENPSLDAEWRFRYDDSDRFPEAAAPDEDALEEITTEGAGPHEATSDAGDRTPAGAAPPRPSEQPLTACVGLTHEETAARVARRIRDLLDDGADPEEIAILSRRSNELGTYRQAVERLGVPTYLVKGTGLFETSEVRDLTALCRFLAWPHSDLRAVEVLRSRFFAVPATAFAALRRAAYRPEARPETPFSDLLREGTLPPELDPTHAAPLEAARPDGPTLDRGLPHLATFARDRTDPGRDRLPRPGRAPSPKADPSQASSRPRTWRRPCRFCGGWRGRGFATFAAAARHLESAASGGHDATQAPVRAEGAVQVLTIHAAKGLEYDHVFLVDLNGRSPARGGGLRVQEGDDDRWRISLIKDSSDWEIRDDGRGAAEECRCLYVGITRARRGLTLSAVARFLQKGGLGKPAGLARFLPPDLWEDLAVTAKAPRPDVVWKRHRLRLLPPVTAG